MRGAGRGRRCRRAAGLLLAGALLLGCTPVEPGPTPGGPARTVPRQGPVLGAAAATTPAAELRAGLTALLLQRAHLLALAHDGAPAEGPLGLVTAELVELTGAPAGLAEALQDEQADVLAGRAPRTDPVAAALARLAGSLPEPEFAEALAALDGPAAEGQGGLDPAAAVRAGELLAAAVAEQRGTGSTRTPAAGVRAQTTALLVHRTALPPGRARTATDRALAAVLVPEPGAARRSMAAALDDEQRLAEQVAAALPTLPAPVLQAELAAGRERRTALATSPRAGRALALRPATDSVLAPAALLAAAVAEAQRLS